MFYWIWDRFPAFEKNPLTCRTWPGPPPYPWARCRCRQIRQISRQVSVAQQFVSHEVIISLISSTTTKKGLVVQCELDENKYPKGIKISDQDLSEVYIEDIVELDLAYAITIHKAQGSEFEIVIIPVLTQHFKMLFRNLIYTGLTRAKKFAFFVGTRKALAMAVKNQDTSQRQTALKELIVSSVG